MYTLTYSDLALKQLKKLSPEIRLRIISAIERCRIRPYKHVKKLVNSPYFRLRAGKYRVILNIKQDILLIFVIEVAHREQIYR